MPPGQGTRQGDRKKKRADEEKKKRAQWRLSSENLDRPIVARGVEVLANRKKARRSKWHAGLCGGPVGLKSGGPMYRHLMAGELENRQEPASHQQIGAKEDGGTALYLAGHTHAQSNASRKDSKDGGKDRRLRRLKGQVATESAGRKAMERKKKSENGR